MNYAIYHAPFGELFLYFNGEQLCKVNGVLCHHTDTQHPLPEHWQHKFDDYFSGSLKHFDYPPSTQGTAFEQAVWRAIANIDYGKTATYSELAAQLHSHPRAIGQACAKNPLPIVIPCHRVLAKNGGLGGFSMGKGDNNLAIKQFLLHLEGVRLPIKIIF